MEKDIAMIAYEVCEENGKWVLRGAVSWGHYECLTDHDLKKVLNID